MSDNWDFFFLLVDDQPASISVDLGIAAEAPILTHPNMAYLSVKMRDPRPDGLSSGSELDALGAIEEHVAARLGAACDALFVGRNTSAGRRDFYFYIPDRMDFDSAAKAAMTQHSDYEWESGSRADPAWSVYTDFLSPSDDDWQRMMNRRVRVSLEQHGDNLSIPRDVDHRAYFQNGYDAASFAQQMEQRNYRVEVPKHMDEGDYAVDFVGREAPADLDDPTVEIARIARDLGGNYDGWGCTVAARDKD